MDYKISVIMPVYNGERYIAAAIESVLQQTYPNWELIVVDDGSTDQSYSVAKRTAGDDSRVKLVQQEHMGTAAKARNTALSYVTGDYIQMLDADDWFGDDLLAKLNAKLQEEAYDIVLPVAIHKDEDKTYWVKEPPQGNYHLILDGETAFCKSINWEIHGFFCLKSDMVRRLGYDLEAVNGDELSTRRFLYHAQRVAFCDGIYYYRYNSESTTHATANKVKMYEVLQTNERLLKFVWDNDMHLEIKNKILHKYLGELVGSTIRYLREHQEYNAAERATVRGILEDTLHYPRRLSLHGVSLGYKVGWVYKLSADNFALYMFLVEVATRLRGSLQRG